MGVGRVILGKVVRVIVEGQLEQRKRGRWGRGKAGSRGGSSDAEIDDAERDDVGRDDAEQIWRERTARGGGSQMCVCLY